MARAEWMELETFRPLLSTFSNISNVSTGNEKDTLQSELPYQAVEMVLIVLSAGSVSLITIIGNMLVMLSVVMNRNLRTINNYFLFSLACADLIIGVICMNLYTVYLVVGYWPLGPVMCDIWLLVDYVVTSVSVWNLLIISFDRYFCITMPLSYPVRRTSTIAGMMIAAAWVLAFILWAPGVLFWQFIVGERSVPEGECDVQFQSNPTIIFITSIVLFFLPVGIMSLLYWQISRASKSRVKKGESEPKQENLCSSKEANNITMPSQDDNVKTHYAEWSQNGGKGGVGGEMLSEQVHLERNEIATAPEGNEGNPTAHSLNATMAKQWPKKKESPSREKKVTSTIMAILVAFVVTWTPYHVMKVIVTFCSTCVPDTMWILGYWIGYMNSTINPACYALCNNLFKKTFKQLLLCQHKDIRLGR